MLPTANIDAILNGASMSAVLFPSANRPGIPATVESMPMRHLFIKEGRVIAASAYDHAWHMEPGDSDPKNAVAYAYTNFCDLVFNFSLSMSFVRGIHTSYYSDIRFALAPNYERIWTWGESTTVAPVRRAVELGRPFKAVIGYSDGLTVVHPLHLVEVWLENEHFLAFTRQTAHPAPFLRPETIQDLADVMADELGAMEVEAIAKEPYVPPYFTVPEATFESSLYILSDQGTAARGKTLTSQPQFEQLRSLSLFAELAPT